jgi:hypothetical protein
MEQLARSPDELESTITNLDDWARQCRAALGPHAAPNA